MHRLIREWTKYVAYFKCLENRSANGFHSLSQVFQIKGLSNAILFSKHLPYRSSKSSSLHTCSRCLGEKTNVLTNHNGTNENNAEEEDMPELRGNQLVSRVEGDDKVVEDETNTSLYDCIDYDKITEGDSEALNKFKLLLLEVEVMRQDGQNVPKKISTEKWKELFALQTRSQRMRLLQFLWTNEVRKLGDLRRKEKKQIAIKERHLEKMKLYENYNHIRYGLGENTIFVRIYDQKINAFDNNKLIQAMMFGQNIVIDCSYDKDMSRMENSLCAKQLILMFAENRLHKEPFNLHYCSLNEDTILFKQMKKSIPLLGELEFPINVTEEHYLNVFPKEKLVYLTPHCRNELKDFNHDDIYIIGAMVDKHNNAPLSLAKAKSEGIRMAQLPLDRYLAWGLGTKSLTINQVLNILLEMRTTGDWNQALQHVPRRKLRPLEEGMQREYLNGRNKFRPPPLHERRGTTFQPPPPRERRETTFKSPPHHERRGTTFEPPPMNYRKRDIS